jgi:hypothetical protein
MPKNLISVGLYQASAAAKGQRERIQTNTHMLMLVANGMQLSKEIYGPWDIDSIH